MFEDCVKYSTHREIHRMNNHNVIGLHTPDPLNHLQEVLKKVEQSLLKQAVESELESRLVEHSSLKT